MLPRNAPTSHMARSRFCILTSRLMYLAFLPRCYSSPPPPPPIPEEGSRASGYRLIRSSGLDRLDHEEFISRQHTSPMALL